MPLQPSSWAAGALSAIQALRCHVAGERGEPFFCRASSRGVPMQCPRCQGLMVTTSMHEPFCAESVAGWRCLLCGEAIDPGIEANRAVPPPSVRSRARVPGSSVARVGRGRG